ncbi:MAG: hypothetical protein R3F44_17190 [Candidatus Competibacteraceae bacterium]
MPGSSRETALRAHSTLVAGAQRHITALSTAKAWVGLRQELLRSFSQSLETVGVPMRLWCAASSPGSGTRPSTNFLTLARVPRVLCVVDAWRTSNVTALEDKASKRKPAGAQAGQVADGGFVEELAELEAKKGRTRQPNQGG